MFSVEKKHRQKKKRWKRKKKRPIKETVVILSLTIGTLYALAHLYFNSSSEQNTESTFNMGIEEEQQPQTLEALVTRFIQIHGGASNILQVQSILASGEIATEEGTIPVTIMKKRPNKLRMVWNRPGIKVTVVYDGETAFRLLEPKDNSSSELEELDPGEIQQYAAEAQFQHPLLQLHGIDPSFEFMGQTEFEGRMYYQIKQVSESAEQNKLFLLEIDSFFNTVLIKRSFDGITESITHFSEFREQDGIQFPYTIEHYSGNSLSQTIRFDRISLNPGLANSLFQKPSSP